MVRMSSSFWMTGMIALIGPHSGAVARLSRRSHSLSIDQMRALLDSRATAPLATAPLPTAPLATIWPAESETGLRQWSRWFFQELNCHPPSGPARLPPERLSTPQA